MSSTAIPAYVFDGPDGPFKDDYIYTPKQVIASGFCGRTSIYRWLRLKILDAAKAGTRWRIWGRDLNALWRKLPRRTPFTPYK